MEKNDKKTKKDLKIKIDKKMSFRKAIEGRGEQFSINFPIELMKDMEITEESRDITIFYNPILKEIKIKKLFSDCQKIKNEKNNEI